MDTNNDNKDNKDKLALNVTPNTKKRTHPTTQTYQHQQQHQQEQQPLSTSPLKQSPPNNKRSKTVHQNPSTSTKTPPPTTPTSVSSFSSFTSEMAPQLPTTDQPSQPPSSAQTTASNSLHFGSTLSSIMMVDELELETQRFFRGELTPDVKLPLSPQMSTSLYGLSIQDDSHESQEMELKLSSLQVKFIKERRLRINASHLSSQPHVTSNIRAYMIDMFVFLVTSLQMKEETIHLASQIVDRVLTLFRVQNHNINELGIGAMHVAAKYVETTLPRIENYPLVLQLQCPRRRVLRMEEVILNAISFELGFPTSLSFAMAWTDLAGLAQDSVFVNMIHYLLELSLIEERMLEYLPSMVAASAIVLSCQAFQITDRPMEWEWQNTTASFASCSSLLRSLVARAPSSQRFRVVYARFTHPIHDQVALTASTTLRDSM
eukprot:c9133_g1_i2.p1 GENE.c9133_g1_i2~~c9133_g1_i2.p1  ORF type:complete len:452 (-),score=129.61 c9133_g1_i2:358-1656(-)